MALTDDTFGELKALTFALIGREYTDTSASFTRLKSLWNYSAKKAYKATNYWERYLVVGDERTVSNKNIVPRVQTNSDTIDTFLRIFKEDPNIKRSVEYKFISKGNGALLTGVAGRLSSDLYEDPNNEGFYLQPDSSEDDSTVFVIFKKAFNPDFGNAGDSEAIPSEFMPYMAHLTAYTWQRSVDQNSDDANFTLSLGLVNSILEDELAKIDDQGIFNSYIAKNIRTNYNQLII